MTNRSELFENNNIMWKFKI